VEGTGLGLSISQRLVSMMNSQLHVKSTFGEGSVFWFDLKLPVIDGQVEFTVAERLPVGFEGQARKILIVDDNESNRTILVRMLKPLGFELQEASQGQEALEKAKSFQPDLILMDLIMPIMDGFEATRQIRNVPALENVVIIAISVRAFSEDRQKCAEAGCNEFMAKPVQLEALLQLMKAHLKLTWIYDNPSDGRQSAGPKRVEDDQFIGPPSGKAAILYELSLQGDVKGIREQIAQLEQMGHQYQPFVTKLRRLASKYRVKQIRKLLKPFVDKNNDTQ
jgi:CheY-like chemotaxis protein